MIPYFDYRPEYSLLKQEIRWAIDRVLDSGQLILGTEVTEFEQECAAYLDSNAAIGVNSGTDALILALRALDVGAGDEVITVANAGVPTVAAIRAVGAVPRFVDIREDNLLMDAALLAGARSSRTRAIIPVHLYGQPVDLDPILSFAEKNDLRVIEDCAQAQGATYRNRKLGSLGDIGCFSFYPTKSLGAYGDGGLCVTSERSLEERLRQQRMYGYAPGERHSRCEGLNSRLDELQAAILRVKLRHLENALHKRRKIAALYIEGLEGTSYRIPALTTGGSHVYHLFVVASSRRDKVIEALTGKGIGYGIHYGESVHKMEAYREMPFSVCDLPVTDKACREVLSLPIYPGLETGAVHRVIDVLKSVG